MAAAATQIANSFCLDWKSVMRSMRVRSAAGGSLAGEDLTARALGGAGLAALVFLPLLLLASVILAAPLAVPAVIGLGYLATWRALAGKHRGRAAVINTSVLSALVGWLLIYLALADDSATKSGLTAAMMTPLFAAAPAFARSYLRARERRSADAMMRRDAAMEKVTWLNEVAPREQVLVLNGKGRVLGATAAACTRIASLSGPFGREVRSFVASGDIQPLLGAIRHCLAWRQPTDVDLSFKSDWDGPDGNACRKGEGRFAVTISICGEDSVAMRIRDDVAPTAHQRQAMKSGGPTASPLVIDSKEVAAPSCDVGDATKFALRHALPKANAMRIALVSSIEPDVVAACDRQTGRRIAQLLIECALHGCQADGSVEVLARKVKGVVLLRAASRLRVREFVQSEASDTRLDTATLLSLVESTGGTLVVDRERDDIILSIRLDLAVKARA